MARYLQANMFNEANINRDRQGQFSEKQGTASTVTLSALPPQKAKDAFPREALRHELQRFLDERIEKSGGTTVYAAWEKSAYAALAAPDVEEDELLLAEQVALRVPHETTAVELLASVDRARMAQGEERPSHPYSLAFSEDTPPSQLARMHTEYGNEVAEALASNTSTPAAILVELSAHTSSDIRKDVAGNVSTPPETLRELSESTDYLTLARVACNRNTPRDVLERMSQKRTPHAKYARETLESPKNWARPQPKGMYAIRRKMRESDPSYVPR